MATILVLLMLTAQAHQTAFALLERAEQAADAARAAPGMAHPDHPQWAEAIALAKEALALAPHDPQVLRFLAEVYTATGWYIRAWEGWHAYARHAQLQPHEVQQLARVGRQLAYARYLERDYETAIGYYKAVLALDAGEVQARVWLGRIYLETGEAATAARYWREVLRLDPEDSRAAYFLRLSEAQLSGISSSAPSAYYRGLALYEAGQVYRAREAFLEATEANPRYVQAWAWLARTRFEQENYLLAAEGYRRALELAPANRDYQEAYQAALRHAGR